MRRADANTDAMQPVMLPATADAQERKRRFQHGRMDYQAFASPLHVPPQLALCGGHVWTPAEDSALISGWVK